MSNVCDSNLYVKYMKFLTGRTDVVETARAL